MSKKIAIEHQSVSKTIIYSIIILSEVISVLPIDFLWSTPFSPLPRELKLWIPTREQSREPSTSHNCENMELLHSILSPNSSLNATQITLSVAIQAYSTTLRLFYLNTEFHWPKSLCHPRLFTSAHTPPPPNPLTPPCNEHSNIIRRCS